ncbi:hypothetical protein DICVIV_10784 [Dictyocaulus viviparus]|uniref:Protein asunder n=1 Tax=Dictyocaulus viviparus TaxID=29172 RepID=A0A0D8XHJ1_DICVI|nr:hypothetical protein DICVIV_10784 [Dictyocaulus viviparus]
MEIGSDHKVLVVLDHGPSFAKNSGNPLPITLKESSVNRVVGKCDKSLWTWCVEATLELHRTVSDLFSQEHDFSYARLIRLVLADYLLNALYGIGLPSTNDDSEGAALSGITLAVEALSQLSEAQMKRDIKETVKTNTAKNEGRSIYLRIPKCWDSPSAASFVAESGKMPHPNCGSIISPTMSSCTLSRAAGVDLISAIHSVAIDIYDLVSSTVSGIPMKEEAQQGQSAVAINYDVELLHRREAHCELERLELVTANNVKDVTGSLMVFSGSTTYPTARLIWATPVPKGRWNMFPRNRHASRVTPSEVNSRPSVCLSSYLLQGRNVMLEVMIQIKVIVSRKELLISVYKLQKLGEVIVVWEENNSVDHSQPIITISRCGRMPYMTHI